MKTGGGISRLRVEYAHAASAVRGFDRLILVTATCWDLVDMPAISGDVPAGDVRTDRGPRHCAPPTRLGGQIEGGRQHVGRRDGIREVRQPGRDLRGVEAEARAHGVVVPPS